MNTISERLSAEDIALAKLSSQELSAVMDINGKTQKLSIIDKTGNNHIVQIPNSALRLMIEILTQLGQGNTVSITPIHAELTPQEAADILNMSRPTFVKLLDTRAIPYSRKGNRRKVAYADIVAYKNELEQKRLDALAELSQLDQEMDMGY